jgi:hypothetical protein
MSTRPTKPRSAWPDTWDSRQPTWSRTEKSGGPLTALLAPCDQGEGTGDDREAQVGAGREPDRRVDVPCPRRATFQRQQGRPRLGDHHAGPTNRRPALDLCRPRAGGGGATICGTTWCWLRRPRSEVRARSRPDDPVVFSSRMVGHRRRRGRPDARPQARARPGSVRGSLSAVGLAPGIAGRSEQPAEGWARCAASSSRRRHRGIQAHPPGTGPSATSPPAYTAERHACAVASRSTPVRPRIRPGRKAECAGVVCENWHATRRVATMPYAAGDLARRRPPGRPCVQVSGGDGPGGVDIRRRQTSIKHWAGTILDDDRLSPASANPRGRPLILAGRRPD